MAKIYLHCKPAPGDTDLRAWTYVLRGPQLDRTANVLDALLALVAAHNAKFKSAIDTKGLVVTRADAVVRLEKKLSQLLVDDTCELDVTRPAPQQTAASLAAVGPLLALATKHRDRGEWRSAKALWETILRELDPHQCEAAHGLVRIYMQSSAWASAKAVAAPVLATTAATTSSSYISLCLDVAECELHLQALAPALQRLAALRVSDADVGARIERLEARLQYASGAIDAAIDTLRRRLIASNETDLEAIALYSAIAHKRGRPVEAMQMILKVLTGRATDRAVQAQFAEFLEAPHGFQHLAATLDPSSATTAPAFAYLATIAKDHSAMNGCLACFAQAVTLAPAHASYALNYLHALEVVVDHAAAYDVARAFCLRNPTVTTGGLACRDVAAALEAFPTLDSGRGSDGAELCWTSDGFVNMQRDGVAQQLLPEDDWDLLALFFAVVKILFLEGCGAPLHALVRLLEPLRVAFGHHLHQTTIRNEHAYYCCIAQLLCIQSPPLAFPSSTAIERQKMHTRRSMSAATRTRYRPHGGHLRLTPALVTGLKHWHLRRASTFYPKRHFEEVISTLPRHARIVFLLGEIDCREGILLAVEKCRYESVDEGMVATMSHFLRVLEALVCTHGFDAYIHPIVPVLDETRHLVRRYNALLRTRVEAASFCKWLDCFEDLLGDNGKLQPAYAFDGTHLHPAYLSNGFQSALAAHM
ncbi:hypothetical protein SPRG_02550 [Saprolegnia parasitica CBS 223.65]|uniref:Uncharacterized protein n=1 Tax=Saprolegnia parasitica (strain CBS 223.65) TaxID=695850 RepID=A0A067D1E6_SAPPC|nr:hypothetical protein SPRG_02550 [Saprolegnia parasitica CBS 223.65]KDO32857.1 hypothetical protein SPRG_02550 [Saprolegnia parasitica CBS 223.65]|eukprot:XP_012196509.1 hypothetical protein SPRG_02550 [Saprolegnia parasitica CBS 223.65]